MLLSAFDDDRNDAADRRPGPCPTGRTRLAPPINIILLFIIITVIIITATSRGGGGTMTTIVIIRTVAVDC